jgi:hypothetical protein
MSVGAYVWYTLGLACVHSSLTICLSLSPLLQNGRVQNTFSTHITTIQYTKISWDSPRHFFALETASNQRVGKRSRCIVPVMVKIATCHSSFGPPRIRVKSHLRLRLDLVKVCVQHLHGIVSFPCVHTFIRRCRARYALDDDSTRTGFCFGDFACRIYFKFIFCSPLTFV